MKCYNFLRTIVLRVPVVIMIYVFSITGYAQEMISPVDTMVLPDRFVVPSDSTTGWLILYGELISPPYEIVVEDSNIMVNGLPAYRRAMPRKDKDFRRDSLASQVHGLRQEFWPSFHKRIERDGLEKARAWAEAFFNEQSFVDTAYLKPPSDLYVKYGGLGAPMVYELNRRARCPKPSMENVRNGLRRKAHMVAGVLHQKSLVIWHGGARSVTLAPDAKKEFDRLKDAAEIPDFYSRFSTMRGIVGDSAMAKLIAERFMR